MRPTVLVVRNEDDPKASHNSWASDLIRRVDMVRLAMVGEEPGYISRPTNNQP